MKKKKISIALLSLVASFALVGCNEKKSTGQNSGGSGQSEEHNADFYLTYKGEEFEVGSETHAIETTVGDRTAILVSHSTTGEQVDTINFKSSDETILRIGLNTGLMTPVKAGSATVTATAASDQKNVITFAVTVKAAEKAVNAYSFTGVSYDEKSRILGAMEKYAVDNYLTGITMFSDGSKVCYNTRYKPTPKQYISGYGWGTWREGRLDTSIQLPGLIAGNNNNMYQIQTTSLPQHLNAMNASGSDVSDVYANISTSYFETRLNQTSDGYEWYPVLSKDAEPIPLNADGSKATEHLKDGTFNKWRIHVRTNTDNEKFVYRTASQKDAIKPFEKRPVVLEDYITPIKFMLTGWNRQYRGAELTTGVSAFAKAAATYYGQTSINNTGDSTAIFDEAKWKSSGMEDVIKTGHDDQGDYIDFELLQPCTRFFAKYYLSSSFYSPLPAEFIKIWGGKGLGKSPDQSVTGSTGKATPVDTMLSTGPYYVTQWENSKIVTFTKNDEYFIKKDTFSDGNTRDVYQIPGFQYNVVQDSSDAKQKFLAGSSDSYGPSKDDLTNEFKENTGSGSVDGVNWIKYDTLGSANFKLNVNACTMDEWNEKFGTKGTVYPHPQSFISNVGQNTFLTTRDYMSNIHFLNFLSFAMNRQKLCQSRGSIPTQDYFSDNYLIDPENGVSYNSTDAHKAVIADRYPETYGYNVPAAKAELKKAMDDVIDPMGQAHKFGTVNSTGQAGTDANPYKVPIRMNWMNPTDTTDYKDVFDDIKQIFEEVINEDYNGSYKLVIDEPTPDSNYQVVYDKMKQGEFDLGFGAISGNDLDPINFMEVLKSDNSSTFTLNWGPNTAKINPDDESPIVYDGKKWSYDALWNAANAGVLLDNDSNICTAEQVGKAKLDSATQSVTYKLSFNKLFTAGARSIHVSITNSQFSRGWDITDADAQKTDGIEFVLSKDFNSYQDDSNKTIETPIATCTISYDVTIKGVLKHFTSDLKLNTYQGLIEG